ncbi:MAG TPA: DUF1569 domain-containing protein [Saprospiraceae bacterium]|nr:DUF1569 domain-containing protein [Saprospiraceae bacterium]MCB9271775.1 DUF1569 domain-containing protein [Lewinellaceae bacterium]HPG07856.1 DUF1569 domain-containing protein [Saprospiraceae bacterium]HPQ99840.1 DUF1569 domain-containing protein [Saprospiraceae bacterium]HQU52280.1 DUF1569 domain-containing protein [Saprospiraceae bacterium]
MKKPLILKNLGEVMDFLDRIENQLDTPVSGDWDAYQNLSHCALAMEFTLQGYPLLHSKLFQLTIGKLAFHYFDWRGYMQHNTSEPTKGTNAFPPNGTLEGVQRLQKAIKTFDEWQGKLYPHEAFGVLTKKQYAHFHSMHIANHLELFKF